VEAYVDGELSAGSRVRIRLHLLACPDCRRHAQLVRDIKRALAGLPDTTHRSTVIELRTTDGTHTHSRRAGETMPRFPVHTVSTAPEPAQPALAGLEKRFGKVLNIHGEMAHAPVVLAAYTGMQTAIREHGSFDAATREAIALAVGAIDDCAYCQSAHTVSGQAAGLDLAQTVAIREARVDFDPKLAALLAVARQIAGNVGDIDDGIWQRAVDLGWSDTELAELFAHVAVNLYTNYFNHYAGTELDIPAAPGLNGRAPTS
jgi:AhpD family alkylhydroperoxidase